MVPTKLRCCQRAHREKKKFLSTPPVPQNCSHGVPLPQRSCSVLIIHSCQVPKAWLSPGHVWSCLVAGQAAPSCLPTASQLLFVRGSSAVQGELSAQKTHQQIPVGQPCGRRARSPSVFFPRQLLTALHPLLHACTHQGQATARQDPPSEPATIRQGLEGHFRSFEDVFS